jgi:DNA-binding MarR family transcriptional regulator
MQLSPVNRSVAERLHAAAIHLLRRLRRQDDAMGLTPARASALSIMVFGGRVTIGQLAQAEHVTAPTMTRLVDGMVRDNLVRREGDPADGRVVWLQATAKGTRILHEGRRRRVAALAEDLATLDPADRDTLAAAADILERVVGRRPSAHEQGAARGTPAAAATETRAKGGNVARRSKTRTSGAAVAMRTRAKNQ